MDKNHLSIQKITGVALLGAIMIVLQVVGNFIAIGPVSINLSLVPIALCAILYGPFSAALLGLFSGVLVLFAPSTAAVFMPISVFGTILVCLIKCTAAGFLGGLVYRLLYKKNAILSYVLCGITIAIVNTGLFVVGCLIFFMPLLEENSATYANAYAFLFLGMIGWNFVFEVVSAAIFVPTLAKIIHHPQEPLAK